MADQTNKSALYALEPLVQLFPEVRSPKRHVSFKEKMIWSAIALILYLVMAQIPVYILGVGSAGGPGFFGDLQYVLASRTGTIMQLGIGPIVTAGIIMQLLVGANLVNLDLHNPEDKSLFTGIQKILAVVVGFFQASAFVFSGLLTQGLGQIGMGPMLFMVLQLMFGVLAVLFLDEMVSKFGFGSGISLFIVGGVATEVFWQAFNPLEAPAAGFRAGAIPNFISSLASGSPDAIGTAFFREASPNMMGVIGTILIFLIVIYAINIRVEIPLSYSQYGGMRGKYPIKFMYTSVIPIILAHVVIANVSIMANITGWSFLGEFQNGRAVGGLYAWLQAPQGLQEVAANPLQAIFYLCVIVVLCMGFAWLWMQVTNMSPSDVADQLRRSGMSIPGFRKDQRIMENMLSRYIFPVTLLGGAFLGVLASGAEFLGALGSGVGILLAVDIIYRLYQEIAKEQLSEMFPAARRLLGD